ncbi:ester cyclase, partial [Litorisediminicola beolgyonensis]
GASGLAVAALPELAAIPERRLWSEDVLAPGGAWAAERFVMTGRHAGDGLWGAPTGRDLRYRWLAGYGIREGRLARLWRVRDSAAILRQIGRDPRAWAADSLTAEPLSAGGAGPASPGTMPPEDGWAASWAELLDRAMEGAFGLFDDQYAPGAELCYPGGELGTGPEAARAFWLGLRAGFPDAVFEIEDGIGLESPLMPPRAALRWRLTGKHVGWGPFGHPSGAAVTILGLSQAEFGPDGLRREWTLYDAGAVWRQIAARAG